MWHWKDGKRSANYVPGSIPSKLAVSKTFIFLGLLEPLNSADPHAALRTFDRLLPLYEWVEKPEAQITAAATDSTEIVLQTEALQLDRGREIGSARWIKASLRERTLNIYLRHAEIQRRLRDVLLGEGCP